MIEENVKLQWNDFTAQIYQGELASLTWRDIEYLHGGGKPEELKTAEDIRGWPHSEIVMFPVVGPVKDYQISVGDDDVSQDQHGIARILGFSLHEDSSWAKNTDTHAILMQKHDGKTLTTNPKSKGNDRPKHLSWPFAYTIEKQISLERGLKVLFRLTNHSSTSMPYMFGWHPAFRVYGSGMFEVNDKQCSLEDVLEVSKRDGALLLRDANHVKFTDLDTGRGILLTSQNFDNIMLWTPEKDAGMVCIEPVTQIPTNISTQDYFSSGDFEVLEPGTQKDYIVNIIPFEQS